MSSKSDNVRGVAEPVTGEDSGERRMIGIEPSRAPELVSKLTDLVNVVYAEAEQGLWVPDTPRCTQSEIAEYLRAGELVVTRRADRPIGCLRLCRIDDERAEFGMLAVTAQFRGTGAGRELVGWAEQRARADGASTMQLEILTPRHWSHPWKEFLASWYERMGYVRERVGRLDEAYPHLVPRLATECDFVVYSKKLEAG
jgi:GNAT superfamily N-acetyltransferase